MPHKYGSTQVNIKPESEAHRALSALQSRIADEHLAGDGRESQPHITVRYGLIDGEDKARDLLSKQAPFTVRLGKTKGFAPSEHSDGASPIYVEVHSDDLHRIHKALGDAANFKAADFDYNPHATLAYVKPENVAPYEDWADADGIELPVHSIHISHTDGTQEEVPLMGSDRKDVTAKSLDTRLQIKAISETGEFEGYASTYSIDQTDERIQPGAFKRTLANSQGKIPILWGHDLKEPVGWNHFAEEQEGKGLFVRGKLAIDTEVGKKAYAYLRGAAEIGAKAGLSIGFVGLKSDWEEDPRTKKQIRVWRELRLVEYSVVVVPANLEAYVTAVKSHFDARNATSSLQLEAPQHMADLEIKKLTASVDGKEHPASDFAFVPDPEKPSTWKLPIFDASHVRNALARFNQTEGIPEDEKPKVLARIHAAAKKFGIDVSDDKKGKSITLAELETMTDEGLVEFVKQNPGALTGAITKSLTDALAKCKAMTTGDATSSPDFGSNLGKRHAQRQLAQHRSDIEDALYDTLSAIHQSDAPKDDKRKAVGATYHKYADAMTDWHIKSYQLTDHPNDGDESYGAGLSKEAILGPMVTKGKKLPEAKRARLAHAVSLHESAIDLHNKAMRICKDMMDGSDIGDASTTADEMGALSADLTLEQKSNLTNPAPGALSGVEHQNGDPASHSLVTDLRSQTKSRLESIHAGTSNAGTQTRNP